MQLSEHFTLEELIASQTATRLGLDNTPSAEVLENLKRLAFQLERVRAILDFPVNISSGYRSPMLNKLVHGAANSAHMAGRAADLICPAYGSPLEVCRAIASTTISFDQVIYEGAWCHFAIAADIVKPRYEQLTAVFGMWGTTYKPGFVG